MAMCVIAVFAVLSNCSTGLADGTGPSATDTQAQSPAKVLVLRDGGVLVGNISRAGDRFVVSRAGSQIEVPAASVLTTCQRLEDAYEYRRGQISRPSVEAHLALAEWCLRYELLPEAARELVDAGGIEPWHPRLKLLERRLMAASKPRPRPDSQVVPAAHTQTVSIDGGVAETDATPVHELPPGAVERFTRKVQPILVNNCTISGCHQPGGQQEFQLDRALLHGLANRRSTTKNLAATLALVDRDEPLQSPLLTVPRRVHGGMRSPIFGPRQQAAFKHLEDWVTLVTAPTLAEPHAQAASGAPNTVAPAAVQTLPLTNTAVDASPDVTDALYLEEDDYATPGPRALRYGAQLQPWQPKDPFDPEIFNRQQRSQRQASANADAQPVSANP